MPYVKLKTYCEEIFNNYRILDIEIQGDDAIIKIKKRKQYSLQDTFKIFYSVIQSGLELDIRTPI